MVMSIDKQKEVRRYLGILVERKNQKISEVFDKAKDRFVEDNRKQRKAELDTIIKPLANRFNEVRKEVIRATKKTVYFEEYRFPSELDTAISEDDVKRTLRNEFDERYNKKLNEIREKLQDMAMEITEKILFEDEGKLKQDVSELKKITLIFGG